MIEAVLFDLDGTLVDTAPDLIGALNRLLQEEGRSQRLPGPLRRHVSGGTRALIGQGFGLNPGDPGYERLAERFLSLYEQHLCHESCLFPGIPELLESLEKADIRWGIVTNKTRRFAEPLVRQLGLAERAACVVSGDSTPRPKPHPDSLLLASSLTAVPPQQSLYLGDDLRDIQAGHAAGMHAVVAAYGYLGDGTHYSEWQGDGVIHHPTELPNLMKTMATGK